MSASGQGAVELLYVSVVSIPVTPSGLTVSVMAIWFAFNSFVALFDVCFDCLVYGLFVYGVSYVSHNLRTLSVCVIRVGVILL